MTEVYGRLPREVRTRNWIAERRADGRAAAAATRRWAAGRRVGLITVALGAVVFGAGFVGVALSDPLPTFRLGTGGESGNYFTAGQVVRAHSSKVEVDVKTTDGGDANLDGMMSNALDGGFTAADALAVYASKRPATISALSRVGALYKEQIVLLCNRNAGVSKLGDLTDKTPIAFGTGGSRGSWTAITRALPKRFGQVPQDPRLDKAAMLAVAEGKDVKCLLYVAAFGANYLKTEAQELGDSLVLVPTADSEVLAGVKDERREPAYTAGQINHEAYPQIMPRGFFGGSKAVAVLEVPAVFVATTPYQKANPHAFNAILDAYRGSLAEIKRRIAQ